MEKCKHCKTPVMETGPNRWVHENGYAFCTSRFQAEPEEAPRTFGDRLGELVVEYSECLPRVDRPRVLNDLEDTTDHAYNQAAIEVAFILTEFSARKG